MYGQPTMGSKAGSDEWIPHGKPRCKYGIKCTRMNPVHFTEESHPKSHSRAVSGRAGSGGAAPDPVPSPSPASALPSTPAPAPAPAPTPAPAAPIAAPPPAREVWVPSGKPRCPYGVGCKRANPTHFADVSHPRSHPNSIGAADDEGEEEPAPSAAAIAGGRSQRPSARSCPDWGFEG